ncbi:MBL fold metallo-hydrolase [Myxococcota bacterium]|nr:MBL fold metallo-hydrolase [Myxococcota bacterium]
MQVTFHGVRGSVAVPGGGTARYGGNTSCVEVRTGAGHRVVLDAGTGVRAVGAGRPGDPDPPRDVWLFLSHTHWDHVQGLPFFRPAYDPGCRIRVHGPRWPGHPLEEVLRGALAEPLFPVPLSGLPAAFEFHEVDPGDVVELGEGVRVRAARLNHPGAALAYRVEADGASFVYATDTAPFEPRLLVPGALRREGEDEAAARARLGAELEALLRGADAVAFDTMFTPEELALHPDWGHGTPDDAVALCRLAGARRLFLFHHAPDRDDAAVDREVARARALAGDLPVDAAFEGLTLTLPPPLLGLGGGTSTHLLVANPTAQTGRNAARIDRVRGWLAGAGIGCDFLPTLPGGATVGAVREALDAGDHRVVIAMGGDGTFREVAAGLVLSARREDVALGMLPTGTANDQGRSFGLDSVEDALEDNLSVVRAGRETRLDAGHIVTSDAEGRVLDDTWFFDSAGWGISARTLAARNQDRRTVEQVPVLRAVYRDKLVYAGAFLRTFLESYLVADKFDAVVESGGERVELTGLTDLVVKGTRVYAGAWVLDRTSRHDDGLFEVVPFRGKRDWTSKAIVDLEGNPLTEEVLNTIGISHSRPFRISRCSMTFRVPEGGVALAAQIDGEEFRATPRVEIEVLARAIRLIVP